MSKEEFLSVLRKNLSVLEEGEINDIIEEYEQHIDMKMKGGLSENDAIHDFGDIKELTSGILEAYHVKADFTKEEKKNVDFSKVVEESKKATTAIGKGTTSAGKWIGKQCKKVWELIRKPFVLLREEINKETEKKQKLKEEKLQNKEQTQENEEHKIRFFEKLWSYPVGILGKLGAAFNGLLNWVWKCVKWCFRSLKTVFWSAIIAFMGLGVLGGVFVLGLTIVLLNQNFPLTGVTVFTFGMIAVNLSGVLLGIIILKKKKLYKVWIGVLAGGVLLTGIGCGVAFGEYSSFTYGGEVKLPGSKYVTKTLDYTIEEREEVKAENTEETVNESNGEGVAEQEKTQTVWVENWNYTLVEDETVPEGTIQFKVTYLSDLDSFLPSAFVNDDNSICFSSGYEYNNVRDFMRVKDILLEDIKEYEFSRYQLDGVEEIEIRVNPKTKVQVQY